MAKFRSRPVEIEAEQFLGFYATPWPPGVQMDDLSNDPDQDIRYQFYVVTAHGQHTFVVAGDWIVTEPNGQGYYPVKPEIFETRWEPIA